jgi:hypothetical protein
MLLCVCLLFTTVTFAQTKGWRGIVPLHSTRADVEKLLGAPVSDQLTGQCQCLYKSETENIRILYANGSPCSESQQRDGRVGGWKVSRDTVLEVTVYFKAERTLSDLKIDESKYKKETDAHLPGWVSYTNREEGIRIEGGKRTITSISYFPIKKDDYLRYPASAKHLCEAASSRPE